MSLLLENNYLEVLRSFCRWTSVRGLHHVLRAEHPLLRTIWAVFVFLMLFANIGLITLLLIHYYQFNTIENIRTIRGIQVAFPHVTLCNVDPVNSYRIYCLQNPQTNSCTIRQKYSYILKKYQEANNYFNTYKDSSIWHKLEDPSMVAIFYQLIGMESATQIGHQINDFILPIFCEVTTREKGGILLKRKCIDAGVLPLNLITYKYFNCYTLAMQNSDISYNAVRLSVILYLDEEEDLNCRPYCTHEFTEWAGGKIIVHSPGSYPTIEESGMNLLPGASNQILVDEMRRIEKKNILSKPCENNVTRNFSIIYFNINKQKFKSRTMNYTDHLCIQLLSQEATMNDCHCIDFLMPIPGTHKDLVNKLPFCGNLSRSNVNESLACSQQVRQKNSQRFRHLCPIPCIQMKYNYELTQLRWPQKPRILNYYIKLKNQIDYNRKFDIYEKIHNIAQTNATLALTMLQDTDIFEKNFLHLDVNRPNFDTLISYRENEEYSLPTLLSQIGGICSIFLSFTCVTVLELIELLVRLILIACPRLLIFIVRSLSYLWSRKVQTNPSDIKKSSKHYQDYIEPHLHNTFINTNTHTNNTNLTNNDNGGNDNNNNNSQYDWNNEQIDCSTRLMMNHCDESNTYPILNNNNDNINNNISEYFLKQNQCNSNQIIINDAKSYFTSFSIDNINKNLTNDNCRYNFNYFNNYCKNLKPIEEMKRTKSLPNII